MEQAATMAKAPVFRVDLREFHRDPYPGLRKMRADAPICLVPELGATLIARHKAIFVQEKRVGTFSS